MVEAAIGPHQFIEHVLARMTKRRVAKVMRERQCLGEIIVKAERTGNGAGDLADFDRMGQPGAVMIALMRHEDLGLMGEAPKGCGMEDPIAIALKIRAGRRDGLSETPAQALAWIGRISRTEWRKSDILPNKR
jgi:hypothetical protein